MPKILVVGSGYAGLICAVAMWRSGFDVTLVGPKPKSFNRTFSLLHGTTIALRSLLADNCPEIGFKVHELELKHAKRWGALRIRAQDFDLPFLLGSVHETTLLNQLISGIENNPAIDWQQTLLDRIDVEQKVAWTTTGNEIHYEHILACDGAHSMARSAGDFTALRIDPHTQTSLQIASCDKVLPCAKQVFSDGHVSAQVPLTENKLAFYMTTYEPADHPWHKTNDLRSHILGMGVNAESLSPLVQFRSPNHLYPSRKGDIMLMGEAAVSQGPVGAQGINGIICDLGILLTQPSFSGAAEPLDQIRSKRYKTNQLTQYSSFMHLGILIQGLIPPVAELFLPQMLYAGAKTSLQEGAHEWVR